MSFIKDLMAWKSRSERKSDAGTPPQEDQRSEDLVAEWQAEAWDDAWGDEGPGGVLDDHEDKSRPQDPGGAAGPAAPSAGFGGGSGAGFSGASEVDALIARLSERGTRGDARAARSAAEAAPGAPDDSGAEAAPARMKISTRPLAHQPIDAPRHGAGPAAGADFAPARPVTEILAGKSGRGIAPISVAPAPVAPPPVTAAHIAPARIEPRAERSGARPPAGSDAAPDLAALTARLQASGAAQPGPQSGHQTGHQIAGKPAGGYTPPPEVAGHGQQPLHAAPYPHPVQTAPQPGLYPAEPAPEPRPSGRAKTRLLGFQNPAIAADPFAQPAAASATGPARFPTGWLIVIDGPGRGACFTLTSGVSQIGRGSDQAVRLDFGDQSISRQGHAAIAYDDEVGIFYLGHGGKMNIVRLNERPVLSTEELASGDVIRIGETVMQFIAFCGPEFSWSETGPQDEDGADAGHSASGI